MLRSFFSALVPQKLRGIFAAFVVAGLAFGAVSLAFGQSLNFHVFRAAFFDLLARHDLYAKSADDYFKYSPTFALLFLPFACLPKWLGAPLWSLTNFVVAYFGIERSLESSREKKLGLLVALAGILLATDGDQSNLLVAGALLLALHAFERRDVRTGAALVTGAAFVKLFPIVGAAFALLAKNRRLAVRALALSALAWLVLPIAVMRPPTLFREYRSWGRLLAWDHANHGWNVMSLAHDVAHLPISSGALQLAGLAIQTLPIALGIARGTDARWRRTLACSLLAFVVLFNHRAEYASFVLSAIAVGVYFAARERRPPLLVALVVLSIVVPGPFLTRPHPSVTGLFEIIAARRQFHAVRVIPLLLLWLSMHRDLLGRFLDVSVRLRAPVPEADADPGARKEA